MKNFVDSARKQILALVESMRSHLKEIEHINEPLSAVEYWKATKENAHKALVNLENALEQLVVRSELDLELVEDFVWLAESSLKKSKDNAFAMIEWSVEAPANLLERLVKESLVVVVPEHRLVSTKEVAEGLELLFFALIKQAAQEATQKHLREFLQKTEHRWDIPIVVSAKDVAPGLPGAIQCSPCRSEPLMSRLSTLSA